ncbi:hypothetical protein ARMGADRAFT_505616 [Armillaria gallica]|uniref:Uncharacterized protein n=1 Tax=Armillaria gallica TaxID=47427 RepID=A0A2H3EGU5_ARMGA|nr:hypothetical protein ARMGADRAFT_505616 [Armillaria gallica]
MTPIYWSYGACGSSGAICFPCTMASSASHSITCIRLPQYAPTSSKSLVGIFEFIRPIPGNSITNENVANGYPADVRRKKRCLALLKTMTNLRKRQMGRFKSYCCCMSCEM